MRRISACILIFGLFAAFGATAAETTTPITDWLQLGPTPTALPAFADEAKGAFGMKDLMAFPGRDVARLAPRAGSGGWTAVRTSEQALTFDAPAPADVWLASYLATDRFGTARLTLTSAHMLGAWLDGEKLDLEKEDEAASVDLEMQTGTHLLLVRCLRDPGVESPWTISATVSVDGDSAPAVSAGTDPARGVQIRDILDAPKIGNVAVSADGKLAAVTLGAYGPSGDRESWIEIRDTKTGESRLVWRGAVDAASLRWLPSGNRFSYTSRSDGKTTVWVYDLDTNHVEAAVRDVEDFGGYRWNPAGGSLVYSFDVEPEKDDGPARRLRAIEDRWPWFRDRQYLVEVSWPEGRSRRLTAGDVSVGSWSFSPKGTHLLFIRSYPDPLERPYSTAELWEMDLGTLAVEKILDERWMDDAFYGRDRDTLLILASPSAFDGLGRDLPYGVVPNDYGGQVYLYDRKTAEATPLSVDYDPTVQNARWHSSGKIVAQVLDKQYVHLATCTLKGKWESLDSGVETISDWSLAPDGNTAMVVGTGAATPQKLYAVDVKRDRARLLMDPGRDRYETVEFGRVEPFACRLDNGEELDGRVHYPLHYDPSRKYPVIVYYYGGTSPITRDFGGRYPKNVWTSRDYFVYVPNPSGALGYGQEYSARHVNDWGRLTAGEVIEGTRKFLEAHPAADSENMACIGASYGGFLTMYLITQTDMFETAVSHAGISSISSYWAEGYWGYAYGARALANSFPWNDRELYVEQSPLFNADKINTSLLLLHGARDTNVPRGESDGLYIALKMLDREVEYVRIDDQDHHILDHEKRIVWNDTILAWFAKKLKGQPAWWDSMYGDE